MYKIKFKVYKTTDSVTKKFFDTGVLAISSINVLPKEGFSYDGIRKRLEISKKFENAKDGEFVELEDSYAEFLKKCVEERGWTFYNEDLLDFLESMKNMEKITD